LETNPLLGCFLWGHQLADGIEYDLELGIIFLLQGFKLMGQLSMMIS
jgi:hypothetical protein